jgi:hypothetical protein
VLLQHFRDRRRQRRLPVVNVTNRPYVAVRLCPFKFFFRHFALILCSAGVPPAGSQINRRPEIHSVVLIQPLKLGSQRRIDFFDLREIKLPHLGLI